MDEITYDIPNDLMIRLVKCLTYQQIKMIRKISKDNKWDYSLIIKHLYK
jgi:hypothetical protein